MIVAKARGVDGELVVREAGDVSSEAGDLPIVGTHRRIKADYPIRRGIDHNLVVGGIGCVDRECASCGADEVPIGSGGPSSIAELPVVDASAVPSHVADRDRAGRVAWVNGAAGVDGYRAHGARASECAAAVYRRGARGEVAVDKEYTSVDCGRACVGVVAADSESAISRLCDCARAGNDASVAGGVAAVKHQGRVVGDIRGERARRAAIADLQGAGADGGGTVVGVGTGKAEGA